MPLSISHDSSQLAYMFEQDEYAVAHVDVMHSTDDTIPFIDVTVTADDGKWAWLFSGHLPSNYSTWMLDGLDGRTFADAIRVFHRRIDLTPENVRERLGQMVTRLAKNTETVIWRLNPVSRKVLFSCVDAVRLGRSLPIELDQAAALMDEYLGRKDQLDAKAAAARAAEKAANAMRNTRSRTRRR